MPAEELFFESTGFGEYKPFLEHAIAHPAKANTKLLEFLVEMFTKPGDVVLDPMAGSGSTGVVAALYGRNAIQVELESKFHSWMEKARENVEKHPTLTPKGWIKNICGDARRLSELLTQVDSIITSPPYSNVATSKEGAISPHMQGLISKLSGIPVKEFAHNVEKLKEAVKIAQSKIPFKYGDSPNNIGNLPLGNVDTIITSPPYVETITQGGTTKCYKEKYGYQQEENKGYSESKENIGNLPLGNVDAVITSPPYAHESTASKETKLEKQGLFKMGHSKELKSERKGKSETYLEAMLKVYREMWKVLKPDGRAIIIVKPFIRNKKVVDLPWHTWLLMAKVGFTLERLYKLRLKQQSFWRILYYKKNSGVPKIAHEYVIITQKPSEA
jgi:hypothetical protein